MASPTPPDPSKGQAPPPSAAIPSQEVASSAASQRALLQQPYKNPYLHTVAIVVTPISLFALFLPPRKLDLRMGILGSVSIWGVLQLRSDWTGQSFGQRISSTSSSSSSSSSSDKSGMFSFSDLPTPEAVAMQKRIREEKLRRQNMSPEDRARLEAQRQKRMDERGTLEAIWMGDAGEDWREKRAEKETKALQKGGGGIWGLMSDQVGEIFSGGGEKGEKHQRTEDKGSDSSKSS